MTQSTTSKEAQVFQLCKELEEMKERKKASAKSFGEEIKRINAEIKELLDPEEEKLP
jgi:uncharacterized membrane protein YukC